MEWHLGDQRFGKRSLMTCLHVSFNAGSASSRPCRTVRDFPRFPCLCPGDVGRLLLLLPARVLARQAPLSRTFGKVAARFTFALSSAAARYRQREVSIMPPKMPGRPPPTGICYMCTTKGFWDVSQTGRSVECRVWLTDVFDLVFGGETVPALQAREQGQKGDWQDTRAVP